LHVPEREHGFGPRARLQIHPEDVAHRQGLTSDRLRQGAYQTPSPTTVRN
jgi:hypothetical protein